MLDLSVVVLVWQDRAALPACVRALAAARGNLALELLLVENGVTLGPEEYAPGGAAGLPVQLIHNSRNRGVAPARNQALERAQGRYLLLLDVDARVTQESLLQLVQYMDAHPDVGLAGPRLEDAQGQLQLTCRALPTVWSKLLRRIPGEWARRALADEMLAAYDHRVPRAVDYCIGACQIIRREAYLQVGSLDEQFVYGPEDVDYCIRLWRDGWRVVYVPQAVVVHDEQRLTRRRVFSRLTAIHALSLARYFWKYRYAFTRPRLAPSPSHAHARTT